MAYTVRTKDNAGDLGRAADQNESVDNDVYFKEYCPQLIESSVFVASATSWTSAAIAGTWRNLDLIMYLRSDMAATLDSVKVQFNADTGNNYSWIIDVYSHNNTRATGEGVGVNYGRGGICDGANSVANSFAYNRLFIPHYANALNQKVWRHEGQNRKAATTTNFFFSDGVGWWLSTSAITSIKIFPDNGTNWVSGSAFYLYGL